MAENEAPQRQVSDDDLANAWEAQTISASDGDEAAPAAPASPPAEPAPAPPEGGASKDIAELKQQIAWLTGQLAEAKRPAAVRQEDKPPDVVYDANGVLQTLAWHQRQQQQAVNNYRTVYIGQLERIKAEVGDAEFKEVVGLLGDAKHPQFNAIGPRGYSTQDAATDAERNYLRAAKYLLKSKQAGTNPAFRQEPAKGAAVPGNSQGKEGKPIMPELDEMSRAFVKEMGMSPEQVTKALSAKSR